MRGDGAFLVQFEHPLGPVHQRTIELPTGVIRQGSLDGVPAGGTATLQLRYAPSGTGTLSGEALVIYGPCPDTLRVSLVGEKTTSSLIFENASGIGILVSGGDS